MKFCPEHQDALKNAISDQGLLYLCTVATELGQEVTSPGSRFDPMAWATMTIYDEAFKIAGNEILRVEASGADCCPLCHLIKHCGCDRGDKCYFREWIPSVSKITRQICEERGICQRPS